MIKISVNAEIKEIENELSVKELLKVLNYTKEGFALAINTTFIAITSYETTIIKDGDTIDILSPVCGG